MWTGIDQAKRRGGELFLVKPIKRAVRAQEAIQIIEGLSDSEIAEANRSSEVFASLEERTAPLQAFLSLLHAFDWLNIRSRDDKAAVSAYLAGNDGDPIDIATGRVRIPEIRPEFKGLAELLQAASRLAEEERFLNWQVAFPGVWTDWEAEELHERPRGRRAGCDGLPVANGSGCRSARTMRPKSSSAACTSTRR